MLLCLQRYAARSPRKGFAHRACAAGLQLPIVKAACCNLIEQSLCEETVPSSLEIADRCLGADCRLPRYSCPCLARTE